jgi:hypothetical protein
MDVWYVTCDLMLLIESLKKNDYWPLRTRQPAGGRLRRKIPAPARSKQPEVLVCGVCS